MTTKTQNHTSFPRLSRIGLGLGLRSQTISPRRDDHTRWNERGADEDWYIPYNGPYEAPRPRRQRERDSWGDPIHGEEDEDTVLAGQLLERYGGHDQARGEYGRRNADGANEDRKSRTRDRTHSVVSGRTVSSGTVDPSRLSTGTQRRSTVSAGNRPPVPSYITLDAAGGVGESPVPAVRSSKDGSRGNRMSLASIFTFGVPPRKGPTSPVKSVPDSFLKRNLSHTGRLKSIPSTSAESPLYRRSSSSRRGQNASPARQSRPDNLSLVGSNDARGSNTTDHEDYYNSYYSTLLNTPGRTTFTETNPANPHQTELPAQTSSTSSSAKTHSSSTAPHPYAYAFPSSEIPLTPQTAPASTVAGAQNTGTNAGRCHPSPHLTFTRANNPGSVDDHHSAPSHPDVGELGQLKNSVSTPNLRGTVRSSQNHLRPGKRLPVPKGKDWWLSPETWCDALLFPRPRLKLKQEGEHGYTRGGMLMSPPGSPIHETGEHESQKNDQLSITSRVLAHSRSLVNLANVVETSSPGAGPSSPPKRDATITPRSRGATMPSRPMVGDVHVEPESIPVVPVAQTLRPPRPRSFAQDDLALPSPVPSLAQVLEEGHVLDHQRQKWQAQATESFQNKRSRNISRARSKSLTQKGKRKDSSNIDFLAARSLLGNQDMVPIVVLRPAHSDTGTSGAFSRSSHSQTNSLSKTLTKSSKSHSRAHSRSDSWSKSALKLAKSTVLCGDTTAPSPVDENLSALDGALRREGTRVIRLGDPAQIPVDKGLPLYDGTISSGNGPSPTPSGVSDSRVGIALSTPPLTDEYQDLDTIRLASHPYAQGGLYTYRPPGGSRPERGSDYAGPHPSSMIAPSSPDTLDMSARHRLPPQAAWHPYAQTSSLSGSERDEGKLIPQVRMDSNVSPSATMWISPAPGIVREILPHEITYSPFMSGRTSPHGDEMSASREARNSNLIYDTVGIGETLAYAVRPQRSKDSGVGTSEDHVISSLIDAGQRDTSLPRRKLVQYDVTRPLFLQTAAKTSELSSNHTFASSPLEGTALSNPRLTESPSTHTMRHISETSLEVASEGSSPQPSPRPLGSPDDIANFHDLFFRPKEPLSLSSEVSGGPLDRKSNTPWDIRSHNRRTGSGLTSLARQLSEDIEQLNAEREREGSDYSSISAARLSGSGSRRPTESNLQFVFEEVSSPESQGAGEISLHEHERVLAFHPSLNLPEDVEQSSRTSTPMTEEDEHTERFRLGLVESVSTPPAVSSHQRSSLSGQMAYVHDQLRHQTTEPHGADVQYVVLPNLQPPSAGLTRSSYITSSSASRMSELSDFPIPPGSTRATPGHMSLLSSYFDEVLTQSETHNGSPPTPPPSRMTFGGNEDLGDLVAALSSHP